MAGRLFGVMVLILIGSGSANAVNALAAGLDELNAIGVGAGIDLNALQDLDWPQPFNAPAGA